MSEATNLEAVNNVDDDAESDVGCEVDALWLNGTLITYQQELHHCGAPTHHEGTYDKCCRSHCLIKHKKSGVTIRTT